MSKTLYHFTPRTNRASILKEGLSGQYDQTAGEVEEEVDNEESPDGVVYLIDRLGGEDEGRDLWQTSRPGRQVPLGASIEDLTAYFDNQRDLEHAWGQSMRRALSRGELSQEEAKKRDWWNVESSDWESLPNLLYHVTTNVASVAESGLKTREEMGTFRGVGLGGGNNNAISFTEDLAVAEAIVAGLREMHDLANGQLSVPDLLEVAKSGKDAKRPFLAELMRGWDKEWQVGNKWPSGVRAILAGKRIERGRLGQVPDLEHEWTPLAIDESNAVWTGTDGQTYATCYEREASEEEKLEDKVELFKRFAAFREWAGGAYDPMFFLSDAASLAALDKDKIQILQVRSTPGAQGYRMGGMKEWRTGSGEAVVVQGVVEASQLKTEHFPGDVWAVDAEGLELEEDVMWSGEGRSWIVAGKIEPERLTLLSGEAETEKVVLKGEQCLGHTAEEIKSLVVAVGDKWEAAFKLWREVESDSDVPSCRNLLGRPENGDWLPPQAVRDLVGLNETGESTGQAAWVKSPYEMLGAGRDRFVVALCAEHVLKVDPYWFSSTGNEVRIWTEASAKLKERLCPVLANGEEGYYGWVVMPRCQEVGSVVSDEARAEVDEVLGLGDIHGYNLGRLKGKLVILDYGTEDESGPILLAEEADAGRGREVAIETL